MAEKALTALWPWKRGSLVDYRALLPERYEVEVESFYEIDRCLGEGGYAKVLRAKDRQCEGRVVAIKKIKKRGPDHSEALTRESTVMRELDHPNICRLFEMFEDKQHMYFVMELCEGGELFDRIVKEKNISEPLSATILDQVVRAMRYAHDRKIAHRDLKPENICFCSANAEDTRVKVIDWGLSAHFAESDMSTAVGTLMYAAPELLCKKTAASYDCKVDVWSLGVVAYVMLCGKPPWWGSKKAILEKILKADYPMSGHPWDGAVSNTAKDFLRRLLQPDPSLRPSSADLVTDPWLVTVHSTAEADPVVSKGILENLRNFSKMSLFRSICVTLIAHQLDCGQLRDLSQLFTELDTSGDGVLQLEEVREGFQRILGPNCPDKSKIDELFNAADLDGSGSIDYTEFCAAGLGQRVALQDSALWAAFHSLDRSSTGTITADDLTSILADADVTRAFSMDKLGEVARELMRRWDGNSDGTIDFEEFRSFMTDAWQGAAVKSNTVSQGEEAASVAAGASNAVAPDSNAGTSSALEESKAAGTASETGAAAAAVDADVELGAVQDEVAAVASARTPSQSISDLGSRPRSRSRSRSRLQVDDSKMT